MRNPASILIVIFCALLFPPGSKGQALAEGHAGQGLDGRKGALLIPYDADLADWPLTTVFWVKILDPGGYSILLASQTKASQAHWEIFTENGKLTLYAPGMSPDHVRTNADLGDGKWHNVLVSLTGSRVCMVVDGALVADAVVNRPDDVMDLREGFAIGRLVEGGLGASAVLDDVMIRRGADTGLRDTGNELPPAEETIVAWFAFEGDGEAPFADARRTERETAWVPRSLPAEVPQITPLMTEDESRRDLQRIAELLDQTVHQHGLTSLSEAEINARPAVLAHWRTWSDPSRVFLWNPGLQRPSGRVYDEQSLYWPEDHDVLTTVLRRTRAMLQLRQERGLADTIPTGIARDLVRLEQLDQTTREETEWADREGLYYASCALRRALMLTDPLLAFDRLVFLSRGTWAGTRWTCRGNADNTGGHFATQNFGFITKPGGGLWVASDWKGQPSLDEPLRSVVVESGAFRQRKLTGSVHSLELSYDAESLLFSHTFSESNSWTWTEETTWNIFRLDLDNGLLRQLTSGRFNDFDACWTPAGDIVFVSERRGGYIRCFRGLPVPTYVLHRMRADGTGIHPISFYETNEWNPSIDHDGRLVYARWDYTDREDCLGSTFWVSDSDGCNPRSPHGNYPYPWSTHPDAAQYQSGPRRLIMAEMGIRAIPGSRKYICTVAPHHGEHYGAIGMIDLGRTDPDNGMEQMERVTPYQPFPESECAGRSNYQYGTPWPLSEDLFLCTSWEDLVVLDRFGNEILIIARTEVPRAMDDPAMRLCDPIPLEPRPVPPVIPERSRSWPDMASAEGDQRARVSVVNVYDTDLPLPEGTRIRWLRVVQNFLKEDPEMDLPRIGYGDENTPRMSLGVAPVEADGSVSFYAPPNKALIFQLLDEDYRAVHAMRSVAFVHRSEDLSCAGCHEPQMRSPRMPDAMPLALRREPSLLEAEPPGREPLAFVRHILPILERVDLACLGYPKKLDYAELEPLAFHLAGGFLGNIDRPVTGGSRTIPGVYGARISVLGREAHALWKAGGMSDIDYRTISLWLDCHSPRLGAFHGEQAQAEGRLVWPRLDVDPLDPLGLEGGAGENLVSRILQTAAGLHPADPGAPSRWRCEVP